MEQAVHDSVHTKYGKVLLLHIRQDFKDDVELLKVAFEMIDPHAMAEAQKIDPDCVSHLPGHHTSGLSTSGNGNSAWNDAPDRPIHGDQKTHGANRILGTSHEVIPQL